MLAGSFVLPSLLQAYDSEYSLKKVHGGYIWLDATGRSVMEVADTLNAVTEWGNILILKYDKQDGVKKRYIFDSQTGNFIKLYVDDAAIEVKFSASDNFAVLYKKAAGRLFFLDASGRQMGEFTVGDILEGRLDVLSDSVVMLTKKPEQVRNTFMIFDRDGELLFEVHNAEIHDSVAESKSGSVLTLSGYNIWNKVFSLKLKREIAMGFFTRISEDEKYLASLIWGADEPYRSEEYARLIGIHDDKITESKLGDGGLEGMFVQLYFMEIYSLETGNIIGRMKLEGNYLRSGNTGNPALQDIQFSEDDSLVSLTADYKGRIERQSFTLGRAKEFMDMIDKWVKLHPKEPKDALETMRAEAKKLNSSIQTTISALVQTDDIAKDRKRAKSLAKQAKRADEKKLPQIISELRDISRRYIYLNR